MSSSKINVLESFRDEIKAITEEVGKVSNGNDYLKARVHLRETLIHGKNMKELDDLHHYLIALEQCIKIAACGDITRRTLIKEINEFLNQLIDLIKKVEDDEERKEINAAVRSTLGDPKLCTEMQTALLEALIKKHS